MSSLLEMYLIRVVTAYASHTAPTYADMDNLEGSTSNITESVTRLRHYCLMHLPAAEYLKVGDMQWLSTALAPLDSAEGSHGYGLRRPQVSCHSGGISLRWFA